ncbi:MAG: hypothetical protein ABDH21_02085 [bacterium]
MNFLHLLYKDFLIAVRSKTLFLIILSNVIFFFLYQALKEIDIRVKINAPDNIKQNLTDFLETNSIKVVENNPSVILTIDPQENYWVINIQPVSFNYLKTVPILNLLAYKYYFSHNNLVDPIKVNVIANFNLDLLYYSLLNMSIWGLLSYISSDIYKEKLKKTAIIVQNVNLFIMSKTIICSFCFLVILLVYNFFVFKHLGLVEIFNYLAIFIFCTYLYGLINWIIKNNYTTYVLNLLVGVIVIFAPMLGLQIQISFLHIMLSLCTLFALWIIVNLKNKQLQKVVWDV